MNNIKTKTYANIRFSHAAQLSINLLAIFYYTVVVLNKVKQSNK